METLGLRRIPVQDRRLHTLHYRLDGGSGLDTLLGAVDLGPRRVAAGLRVELPVPAGALPALPQEWSVCAGPAAPVWSPEELCTVRARHDGPYDRLDLADSIHGPSLAVSKDAIRQVQAAAAAPVLSIQDLEESVARHPALVVRLLTVLPERCEVHTIGAALSYLGTRQLGLWLNLFQAQQGRVNRFSAARATANSARDVAADMGISPRKAYLVGLINGMATVSGRDPRVFLDDLSLAQDIRCGILRREGPVGRLLGRVGQPGVRH